MSHPWRMLIVEDDPSIGTFVKEVLAAQGWSYEVVPDIRQAEDRLRSEAIPLLLTGLTTSVDDDLHLLRRIRRAQPDAKMVVLARAATSADVIAAIQEHAFAVCVMPCPPELLVGTIRDAFSVPDWRDGIEVLSAKPEWLDVRVRCQRLTANRLVHFMDVLDTALGDEDRQAVGMAFREMLLNAVEHGGQLDREKFAYVTCVRTPTLVMYLIRDPGEGFSEGALPQSALSNPPDAPLRHAEYREHHHIRPGGFGLLLTRGIVDELVHNGKGNEVVMIKHLGPS